MAVNSDISVLPVWICGGTTKYPSIAIDNNAPPARPNFDEFPKETFIRNSMLIISEIITNDIQYGR